MSFPKKNFFESDISNYNPQSIETLLIPHIRINYIETSFDFIKLWSIIEPFIYSSLHISFFYKDIYIQNFPLKYFLPFKINFTKIEKEKFLKENGQSENMSLPLFYTISITNINEMSKIDKDNIEILLKAIDNRLSKVYNTNNLNKSYSNLYQNSQLSNINMLYLVNIIDADGKNDNSIRNLNKLQSEISHLFKNKKIKFLFFPLDTTHHTSELNSNINERFLSIFHGSNLILKELFSDLIDFSIKFHLDNIKFKKIQKEKDNFSYFQSKLYLLYILNKSKKEYTSLNTYIFNLLIEDILINFPNFDYSFIKIQSLFDFQYKSDLVESENLSKYYIFLFSSHPIQKPSLIEMNFIFISSIISSIILLNDTVKLRSFCDYIIERLYIFIEGVFFKNYENNFSLDDNEYILNKRSLESKLSIIYILYDISMSIMLHFHNERMKFMSNCYIRNIELFLQTIASSSLSTKEVIIQNDDFLIINSLCDILLSLKGEINKFLIIISKESNLLVFFNNQEGLEDKELNKDILISNTNINSDNFEKSTDSSLVSYSYISLKSLFELLVNTNTYYSRLIYSLCKNTSIKIFLDSLPILFYLRDYKTLYYLLNQINSSSLFNYFVLLKEVYIFIQILIIDFVEIDSSTFNLILPYLTGNKKITRLANYGYSYESICLSINNFNRRLYYLNLNTKPTMVNTNTDNDSNKILTKESRISFPPLNPSNEYINNIFYMINLDSILKIEYSKFSSSNDNKKIRFYLKNTSKFNFLFKEIEMFFETFSVSIQKVSIRIQNFEEDEEKFIIDDEDSFSFEFDSDEIVKKLSSTHDYYISRIVFKVNENICFYIESIERELLYKMIYNLNNLIINNMEISEKKEILYEVEILKKHRKSRFYYNVLTEFLFKNNFFSLLSNHQYNISIKAYIEQKSSLTDSLNMSIYLIDYEQYQKIFQNNENLELSNEVNLRENNEKLFFLIENSSYEDLFERLERENKFKSESEINSFLLDIIFIIHIKSISNQSVVSSIIIPQRFSISHIIYSQVKSYFSYKIKENDDNIMKKITIDEKEKFKCKEKDNLHLFIRQSNHSLYNLSCKENEIVNEVLYVNYEIVLNSGHYSMMIYENNIETSNFSMKSKYYVNQIWKSAKCLNFLMMKLAKADADNKSLNIETNENIMTYIYVFPYKVYNDFYSKIKNRHIIKINPINEDDENILFFPIEFLVSITYCKFNDYIHQDIKINMVTIEDNHIWTVVGKSIVYDIIGIQEFKVKLISSKEGNVCLPIFNFYNSKGRISNGVEYGFIGFDRIFKVNIKEGEN